MARDGFGHMCVRPLSDHMVPTPHIYRAEFRWMKKERGLKRAEKAPRQHHSMVLQRISGEALHRMQFPCLSQPAR